MSCTGRVHLGIWTLAELKERLFMVREMAKLGTMHGRLITSEHFGIEAFSSTGS